MDQLTDQSLNSFQTERSCQLVAIGLMRITLLFSLKQEGYICSASHVATRKNFHLYTLNWEKLIK